MTSEQAAAKIVMHSDFRRFEDKHGAPRTWYRWWRKPLVIPASLVREIVEQREDAASCVMAYETSRVRLRRYASVPRYADRKAERYGISPLLIISIIQLVLAIYRLLREREQS